MTLLSILLGILALGFLVFIHELGHYIVARRAKMRVEVFSIGFGKPIFSWMRDGVKWQVCFLPFGGYVKIAGMHKEKGVEPSDIPDGFFGKKPSERIKVALAGPIVNIVFSLIAFTTLFFLGGRNKPFSQFTHRIGWVDEKSELFSKGVRPGDEITFYDDRAYTGMKDVLLSGAMDDGSVRIKGNKIDYFTKEKIPFDYTLSSYEDSSKGIDGFKTIGISDPARYLVYTPFPEGRHPFPVSESIKNSGLEKDDRIVWVNGELIFSQKQLQEILNESTAYLTIERRGKILQTRVPRVQLQELKLSADEKEELKDWKYEISLSGPLYNIYFIPYDLSNNMVVGSKIAFIDKSEEKKAFTSCYRCKSYFPLSKGDKIVAIDGQKVSSPYDFLQKLQEKRAVIIVQKHQSLNTLQSFTKADRDFDTQLSLDDLNRIVAHIGSNQQIKSLNKIALLNPIKLQQLKTIQSPELKKNLSETKKAVLEIKDTKTRDLKLKEFNSYKNSYLLGIQLQDRQVVYNPSPFALFGDVFSEIQRTLTGLVSGYLSPKHLAGPIGIMHVVQQSWGVGVAEAIFWVGMISLNLGLLNLLPIPVLDGGHIVFSLVEMVTKKPLKAKTMEKLILPFVFLMIGFFIYITFHDLSRIFNFFK